MKISTTSYGTYKPVVQKNNISANQKTADQFDTKITNEEKKFFTSLYPEHIENIEKYNFYNRDGSKKNFSLGSLIDRRG
jgi:hypothetical protein